MRPLFRNSLGGTGRRRRVLETLPDSCLRAFTMPSDGLSGLDPHRFFPVSPPGRISRGGRRWRRFSFREIRGWNSLPLRPPVPAAPFLLQQLFDSSRRLTASIPGGVLDLVAAIIIPLASLAGVTELATKALGSIIQPTAQELLGGGRRPLLQALSAGLLLFNFVDSIHLLRKTGRPPNWQTARFHLNFKCGTASSTSLRSPQSAPTAAVPDREAVWFPYWFHIRSACPGTAPPPPGLDTGRYGAWRRRTESHSSRPKRWAYSRKSVPLHLEARHGLRRGCSAKKVARIPPGALYTRQWSLV